MNTIQPSSCKFLKGALPIALAVWLPSLVAQSEQSEEVYELSPFAVEAADSTGYQATSTLAGTRIKTNLKDLGASISVVTEEFMDDGPLRMRRRYYPTLPTPRWGDFREISLERRSM